MLQLHSEQFRLKSHHRRNNNKNNINYDDTTEKLPPSLSLCCTQCSIPIIFYSVKVQLVPLVGVIVKRDFESLNNVKTFAYSFTHLIYKE